MIPTIEWSNYRLTDIPFLAVPAIKIGTPDPRANGRLYYKEIALNALREMREKILSEAYPIVFLRTESSVLGNGKSALMAAVYWELYDKKSNVLWTEAPLDARMRDLLTRVLDSMILHGKIPELKATLAPISKSKINDTLVKKGHRISTTIVYALNEILNTDDDQLTYVYTNIRRRVPAQHHIELFGGLLDLFYSAGESRFTVFIDQFERYVVQHTSEATRQVLAHQLNSLQRTCGEDTTLVVSTYPEANTILTETLQEGSTFTKIVESAVDLPQFDEDDLLKMTEYYLTYFRPDDYSGETLFPFEEMVVRYSANRVSLIPRDLIIALRMSLVRGALAGFPSVDGNFIKKRHGQIFGGLENKWEDFLNSKFRYSIE